MNFIKITKKVKLCIFCKFDHIYLARNQIFCCFYSQKVSMNFLKLHCVVLGLTLWPCSASLHIYMDIVTYRPTWPRGAELVKIIIHLIAKHQQTGVIDTFSLMEYS